MHVLCGGTVCEWVLCMCCVGVLYVSGYCACARVVCGCTC